MISAKLHPGYNSYEITRNDIKLFTDPPKLEARTSTLKGSKSNTSEGILQPGDWEVTLNTRDGLLVKGIHSPGVKFALNDVAQRWNNPNPEVNDIYIHEPDFEFSLGKDGSFRYAIKEQGIKRALALGGTLSITAPNFQLAIDQASRTILVIREPDPRPLH